MDDAPQQTRPIRLAYVVSHPIQYQAPLLRAIAADAAIDLTVFFCSDFSLRSYQDAGFGATLTWDVPLTDGYRHVVLPRWRDTSNPGALAPVSRGIFCGLRKGIDGKRFDAVWIHGYSSVDAVHAILAARLLGLPVLLRAEPWLADRLRSRAKLWLKRISFALLRRYTAAVLPIGTRNAEYWAHYFGPQFPSFLMPYAVDNAFFANGALAAAATRAELQDELQLDPGRAVILFASKLQSRKRCSDLLDAYLNGIAELNPEQKPHLLIVGDGEQKAALQQRALEQSASLVRFAGFRNQRELPRFFDLASVFVLPSQHEAWGLVVNEAMACGLPVIASTDVGCAADLVKDGVNGFIVPVGNVPALQRALVEVCAPGHAQQMGEQSRQIIAKWSFREDIAALKRALAFVTGLPVSKAVTSAHEESHAVAL